MKNIESFDSFNEGKNWIKDAVKKPGSLRKSLHKKKGEKITKGEISSEISKLKKKDRDKDKPGLQLGKRDKSKYKKLTLARTLKSMNEQYIREPISWDTIFNEIGVEGCGCGEADEILNYLKSHYSTPKPLAVNLDNERLPKKETTDFNKNKKYNL